MVIEPAAMVSGGGHLARIEIKCPVLDSAKIQVNHRARRVKTDQIGAFALRRA